MFSWALSGLIANGEAAQINLSRPENQILRRSALNLKRVLQEMPDIKLTWLLKHDVYLVNQNTEELNITDP